MAERSRYHHGDLRRALLDAALVRIARDGAEQFSLRAAARDVGVSATAAYRHFADRSDLLAALAMEGFTALADAMVTAREATPRRGTSRARARAGFVAVGRAYVEFALAQPARFVVMFGAAHIRPRVRGRAGTIDRDPYELLSDALDELVVAGELTAARRRGAEAKAWAVVHGTATLLRDGALVCRTRAERAALVESVLGFAADGLRGRAAR